MAELPIIMYENVFPTASTFNATDTDSDPAYDVDNVLDFRPYTRWKAASSGTKYIDGTWGTDQTVTCVAIVGHNLATVGATIKVQYFAGTWQDATTGFTAYADEAPIIRTFTGTLDTAWRIELAGCTAAPEVGVVLLGRQFEFERYLTGQFDPFGESVVAEQATSQTGELLGSTFKYRQHSITAQWTRLNEAWVRTNFLPAWEDHLSQLKPFVWAWNPTGTWLNQAVYVVLGPGAALATPYDPIRQSLTLNMRGVHRP